MRVLVAMSGGVDSSVAAALLQAEGHEVVGATMKLWGGESDSGCCSVADVVDARRVADRLGIEHHVFELSDTFETHVVEPYVLAHAAGRTPNPCAECNRHVKFRRFLDRARRLGFEAVATGHHARVVRGPGATVRLLRGADHRKDQSYVLAMLGQDQLRSSLLPVGEHTKAEVRELATRLSLPTAQKAESQEVCFIQRRGEGAGRHHFLARRLALHEGRVIDVANGEVVGSVPAVELVTIGQRRGLGTAIAGRSGSTPVARRYAIGVDVDRRTVLLGEERDLLTSHWSLESRTWTGEPLVVGTAVRAQASAHGRTVAGVLDENGVLLAEPARRVAPGQLVALYVGDEVVGSGVAGPGGHVTGAGWSGPRSS